MVACKPLMMRVSQWHCTTAAAWVRCLPHALDNDTKAEALSGAQQHLLQRALSRTHSPTFAASVEASAVDALLAPTFAGRDAPNAGILAHTVWLTAVGTQPIAGIAQASTTGCAHAVAVAATVDLTGRSLKTWGRGRYGQSQSRAAVAHKQPEQHGQTCKKISTRMQRAR